jgi:hypothetical protein
MLTAQEIIVFSVEGYCAILSFFSGLYFVAYFCEFSYISLSHSPSQENSPVSHVCRPSCLFYWSVLIETSPFYAILRAGYLLCVRLRGAGILVDRDSKSGANHK